MRIGIDAKRIFNNATGLGNSNRTLVQMLINHNPEHEYVLYTAGRKIKPLIKGNCEVVDYNGIFKSVWRSRLIVQNLKKDRIDLFLGPTNEIPFGLQRAAISSVVLIHDLIFKRYPQQYPVTDRFFYNMKSKFACRNATHIVAASEATKQDIIRYYGIDAEKISVIYQSCDASYFQTPPAQTLQMVKEKYALPATYAINVGSVIERKNLMKVVEAYALLPEDERIPLMVIGSGNGYAQKVKEVISERQLDKWFIFLNGVPNEDLPALYHRALFSIYPSYCEGFGIPVLESMVREIPVITGNISSLTEVAGDAALLVDPFNANAIADAIRSMVADNELRKTLISKGKEQRKKFDNSGLSDQWSTVFQIAANKQ